ncbi:MAG: phage minor head protein [Magnetococcus sp. YQC-5]
MPTLDLGYALGLPPEKAIDFLTSKGMRFSWDWHDTWKEAHAKSFTVAKAVEMEVLKTIRAEVEAAIKSGATREEFMHKLSPQLKQMGWWGRVEMENGVKATLGSSWRLKNIYQTNLQTSFMAGRWKGMQDNADARPYWKYVAVMDSRTRPAHRAMHGKVFRYDDPFWSKFTPPNGWRCRCRMRALSVEDVKSTGVHVESSGDRIGVEDQVVGKNSKTGEPIVRPVSFYRISNPSGRGELKFKPDPGWDYNPGQAAWQPDLDRYGYRVASQYLEGAVTGPDFTRFFNRDVGGEFPVAVLDDRAMKALNSKTQVVKLSAETLEKQFKSHPELTIGEYQKLPRLTQGDTIQQGDHHLVFFKVEDRLYKGVVKSTRDNQELYMVTFYRTDEGEMRRDAKQSKGFGNQAGMWRGPPGTPHDAP